MTSSDHWEVLLACVVVFYVSVLGQIIRCF